MSALTVEPGALGADTAFSGVRGGVRVRERVIEKVVREASAATIGIPRGDADVDVAEWGGGLAVRVAARLPIPDLDDTDAIRSEIPVLARIRRMQSTLAEEIARLTGREVRRVSMTVTGALVAQRKRVR